MRPSDPQVDAALPEEPLPAQCPSPISTRDRLDRPAHLDCTPISVSREAGRAEGPSRKVALVSVRKVAEALAEALQNARRHALATTLSSAGENVLICPALLCPKSRHTNLVVWVVLDPVQHEHRRLRRHRANLRMALVAVAQIYTILILRNELRRTANVLHGLSTAMGEQSDLKRRVTDLEEEVTGLMMRG